MFDPTWESLREHRLPDWYDDAKFGIFIHWGLYSVPAWAPPVGELGKVQEEEWFFNNPYAEWYLNSMRIEGSPTWRHHVETYGENFKYEYFADMWKAESWDPDRWAELFERAGARYVVITTKHHDGFCLWPSSHTDYNAFEMGPKRDVVGELSRSVRKRGLRFGVYYSGALDWTFTEEPIRRTVDLKFMRPVTYEYADYAFKQFSELIDEYSPDILWNDIGWPEKGREDLKHLFARFYNLKPEGVVNDRWEVPHHDFTTAEYHHSYKEDRTPSNWEFCRGMGFSFGYNRNEDERHTVSHEDLVRTLADVVSKNGNLLLNVGPMANGEIPRIQVERLERLGKWLKKNGEAIYSTRPCEEFGALSPEGLEIRYTCKGEELYAIVLGKGKDEVTLPGLKKKPGSHIEILGLGEVREATNTSSGLKVGIPGDFGTVLRIRPRPERIT